MTALDISIQQLVADIQRGQIRLPELQRDIVWKAPQVRDLLDSIYRGYPTGSILTWETDDPVPLRTFGVDQDSVDNMKYQLLLDGQQRLTTMSAVLRGVDITVKGRKRPIHILFNLEHPEHPPGMTELGQTDDYSDPANTTTDPTSDSQLATFALHSNRLANQPHWVSVTEALKAPSDANILKSAGVSSFDDPRYEKYTNRLARLRGIARYTYRVNILDGDKTYEEVTDIFVRVNSLGTKLKGSDLALAQITARWPGSLKIFQEYTAQTAQQDFDLDMSVHLKVLVSIATGQSRFRFVSRVASSEFPKSWKRATDGISFAINFLKSNIGIEAPMLLSSPYIIVALAVYGDAHNHEISNEEAILLRRWCLAASTKGRYSGSSETALDEDISAILNGNGAKALLQNLERQAGRLAIDPVELIGASIRSPHYKTMFLAFRDAGATGWDGVRISLDHSGNKFRIQSHHLFPKALLSGRPDSEVNDLANLAFITASKNQGIGKTEPSKYLANIEKEELVKQCIPSDRRYWRIPRYEAFLERRRKLIAKRLNEFIGA